jgi:hypothetical protein
LGALQEGEIKMLENIMPNPTSWGNVETQLRVLLDRFKKTYDYKMKNRGYLSATAPIPGARKDQP